MHLISSIVAFLIGLVLIPFHALAPAPTPNLAGNTVQEFAGSTYYLNGAGVSSSATSFTLTSLTIPQTGQAIRTADLSNPFFVTIEPGSRTKQEIVSCTTVTQNSDTTATLSGCSRGLSPITPYTASTTLQFSHSGGSQVIFSNPPQQYNNYLALANQATSTAVLYFSSTTPPQYDETAAQHNGNYIASTSELASIDYVNHVALVSAPNAATGVKGVVQLGTAAQAASSTALNGGSTGASLVLSTNYATDTRNSATAASDVLMSDLTGYLNQAWLNLAANFTWTGTHIFNGAVTILANAANKLTLNGVAYVAPGSQAAASSTVLENNGSGVLSWEYQDWTQLASTTISSPAATTTITFATSSTVRIYVDVPTIGGTYIVTGQFNNDTGADYGYVNGKNNAGLTGSNSVRNIVFNPSETGDGLSFEMTIMNSVPEKSFWWMGALHTATASAQGYVNGMGAWSNTSLPITSFSLGCTGNCPAKTRITVYGSVN